MVVLVDEEAVAGLDGAGAEHHGLVVVEAEGAFEQDPLAGLEGFDGHGGVVVGAGGNVDELDFGVLEQVLEAAVTVDGGVAGGERIAALLEGGRRRR